MQIAGQRRVPRIGVVTHVRTGELGMIADLDTLLIALHAELAGPHHPVSGLDPVGPGSGLR